MKTCNSCDEKKDESEFHKDKSRKDGLANNCKPCVKKDSQLPHVKANRQALKECDKCHQQIKKFSWTGHVKSHEIKQCKLCPQSYESYLKGQHYNKVHGNPFYLKPHERDTILIIKNQ